MDSTGQSEVDALILRETRSIGGWSRVLAILYLVWAVLFLVLGLLGLVFSPKDSMGYFYFPVMVLIFAAGGTLLYRAGKSLHSFGRLGNADRTGFGNGLRELAGFFRLLQWLLALSAVAMAIMLLWLFAH